MKRRNFLKGVLGSIGAMALPATADKFIESIGQEVEPEIVGDGQLYYDTTADEILTFNGTEWVCLK